MVLAVLPETIAASSIPLPMLLLERSGRVRGANVLAQDCLGLSQRRLAGMRLSDLFAPDAEVERLIARASEGDSNITVHGLSHRQGGAPFALHAGNGDEGLIVLLSPETNRQAIEQQAHRQEMAEAVARIALEMAHEVKNPLAALRGAAQWLSEQGMATDQGEAAHMMLREVDLIRERIDAFLQLGPRANVQMQRLNIHTLLDEVCIPPAGVHLRKVYDPSLPDVLAHGTRLRQAIENLWRNALEAGAEHIEWQTRIAPLVRLPDHSGPVIEARITNDGAPVAVELRHCLFEPFVTAKQRGSGLGLAIVQRVMQEHGGRVQYHCEEKRTSFSLQFPVREVR